MHNTYILSYDPLMRDPTPARLIQFVRSNVFTYQYLTPFVGTLVIKSTAASTQLLESYNPFLSPSSFLLTQIFPTMTTGLLPPHYWNWINAATPPALPSQ